MEEILHSVSKPYTEENFRKRLSIFLGTRKYDEMYNRVVAYYKDREIGDLPKRISGDSRYEKTAEDIDVDKIYELIEPPKSKSNRSRCIL